jgi:fumarylacetoacetate (FAA) hydrolase
MLGLIHAGPQAWLAAQQVIRSLEGEQASALRGSGRQPVGWEVSQVKLLPPLPRPMSVRDFYAFEDHVASAWAARGREIPEAWYEFPVFYFSNANASFGPEEPIAIPLYSKALDYELEVACVVGQPGRDIPLERAGAFVFGYTIFNDWSARDVQRRETEVGLGPAKGKDFASSFGPAIVTPDELEDKATDRPGVFDLVMTARVNGEERSRGNWKDLHYSFGEMIARASAEVFLLPGEIIGSGTVGSGSLLELTGGKGPWLKAGDVVELEVERLGVLRNPIRAGSSRNAEAPKTE